MALGFSEGSKAGWAHSHAWLPPGLSRARAHMPCSAVEGREHPDPAYNTAHI